MKRNSQIQIPPVIIKDDSSLHALLERLQKERERLGIQVDQETINPEATVVNRRHRRERTKIKPSKSRKTIVREFALLITPAPYGGYLAYCPAVYGYYARGKTPAQARKQLANNLHQHFSDLAAKGKSLPRSSSRIEKLKISLSV
ncbi:type II toxin-antitoxin system HicB family antitoxin [candidate division KSB1 bacterium]|nr:type II toxin-antitoxin system HicB family antitoxin [candidate division KSB1 bacterium]